MLFLSIKLNFNIFHEVDNFFDLDFTLSLTLRTLKDFIHFLFWKHSCYIWVGFLFSFMRYDVMSNLCI